MNNNLNVEEPFKKRRRKNIDVAEPHSDDAVKNSLIEEKCFKIRKKHIPKFRFKLAGENASLIVTAEERVPLMLTDVQHLLLHPLLGNINLCQAPRWYVLEKSDHISHITCMILEGVDIQHWEKYNKKLLNTQKIFNHCVELLTPSIYNGSLVTELALVPLSETDKELIIQKYGSMNLALEARKDLMAMMRAVFPIGDLVPDKMDQMSEDAFPRTQLILSAWQLIEESYPLPLFIL